MPRKCYNPAFVNNMLVPFGTFLGSTPVIPDIYWNVYDSEQRWKWICCNLMGLIEYSNKQSDEINELEDNLSKLQEDYEKDTTALNTRVSALEEALKTIITSMLVYDATKGTYTASIDQSRRMLQILGQPDDVNMTVDKLSKSGETVKTWAEKYICAQVVNESMKRFLDIEIPEQKVGGV